MHAIVESRPGDDPALYLLGNEQEVYETTSYLLHLADGARHAGFQVEESSQQSENDIPIIDNFKAALLEAALIEPEANKLSGETGTFALSMLSTDDRALYDEAYVELEVGRIDSGEITHDTAATNITNFERTKLDFAVLDENGYDSYIKDGQVTPYARTLNEESAFVESDEEDDDPIDLDKMKEEEPERYAEAEAIAKMLLASERSRPVDLDLAFNDAQERELAKSVGTVAFTKQFDLTWDQNGKPTLGKNQPHTMLWKKSDNATIPLEPVATILSPDHPVRANQPTNPPAA